MSIDVKMESAAAGHAGDSTMSNRRIIELVRASLDQMGHQDIAVDRQWIDEDTPGEPFLLNVPVGADLIVPLRALSGFLEVGANERMSDYVRHFAGALVNLRRAERMLGKYSRDVRRAALRAITDARADGLDVQLAGVGFKPTYAWHLSGSSWKDAASHVLAVVEVRCTSFYLQPEVARIIVEEPEDVAHELETLLDEQRERQARLVELGAAGADLVIDGITLDLLRMHVSDVAGALREVWRRQHLSLPIQIDGFDTNLSLITSDGSLESGLQTPEAYWNGRYLWMTGKDPENGLDLVGKTLAGRVSDPTLSSRPLVRIERADGRPQWRDLFHFDMSDRYLFDADTGRIWPMEARLAA